MCKRNKADYVENNLGKKMVLDKLIVMDDVSGLADKSDEFANFLTVSRKYGITCVYIFHIIYPRRQNWQMIMSQTKIFNFFPRSVQPGSILRILSSVANRYENTYISHRNIWINRLYFEISNFQEKQCLTIYTRDVSALGPGIFRTHADNGTEQICYYNRNKIGTSFNSFLATKEQTSQASKIEFSIVKVIDSLNRSNVLYSEVTNELSNLKNDNVRGTVQQISGGSHIVRTDSARSK